MTSNAVEAGMKDFAFAAWFGFMLPPSTPQDIATKISTDVGEILKRPDVRQRLSDVGLVAEGMTPQAYSAYLTAEYDKLKKLLTKSGAIKP